MKFWDLRVLSVEPTAEDAACVTLEVPAELRGEFAFKAGQYLTVRWRVGERDELRTYSIVSHPDHAHIRLGVRAQPGGRVSPALTKLLKPGATLAVARPLGRFHSVRDPERARVYVAIAAGSGVTPILSVLTDILRREPKSHATLIYGNRSSARTMFLEEILALKNVYLNRFAAYFLMSREPQPVPLFNGRIDAAKLKELAGEIKDLRSADECFACGPDTMVEEVKAAMAGLNPAARIYIERFIPAPRPAVPRPMEAATAPPPSETICRIGVTMDGRRREFAMHANDQSVLESAERAGLTLPFSCRDGICATCRVRVKTGKVVMAHNIALEPWETEAGFILACQSRPTSDTLELTYDEK